MVHYTLDNTDGFTAGQLADANELLDNEILGNLEMGDSMQGWVADNADEYKRLSEQVITAEGDRILAEQDARWTAETA